jgi:predicted alpha/beta-hydrolase family hydrolase
MTDLASAELQGVPVVTGGRSSGARVACRTATATGAVGVLCLAFPLQPPRRAGATAAPSREDELDLPAVDVLVVQGDRDAFGMPSPRPRRRVVPVAGDHRLRADLGAVAAAVRDWLGQIGSG